MTVNYFTVMKMVVKIINLCLLILLIGCPVAWAWRSFKVIFTQFDYQANSNYLDAKIQIQNNTETSLNVAINTAETLDDVFMTAVIALETNEGNYTSLINRTLNFCKFLKQRNSEPVLRIIYEDLMRHGKFFKECPIKKGAYTIHEYRIDEEILPSYLPETNFKCSMIIKTANGIKIFSGDLYGRIDKSKGFNNLKMFSMG